MKTIARIAIIGSGNAGSYFLHSLRNCGLDVIGYSRNEQKGFKALSDYSLQVSEFDLTLLCVADNAIGEVSSSLPEVPGILAHISGVTELSAIDKKHRFPAVFYPLMSLTPESPPELKAIPFCIEAPDSDVENALQHFAASLGASAHLISARARAFLHLGAVFSQNFSNYLFTRTKDILDAEEIDFRLLLPLLEQSLERLKFSDPGLVQTGPAVRGDNETMSRHLQMLNDDRLKELYTLMSQNIETDHDEEL